MQTITAEIRLRVSTLANIIAFQRKNGYLMTSKGGVIRKALEDFEMAITCTIPPEEIFTEDIAAVEYVGEALNKMGKGLRAQDAKQIGTIINKMTLSTLNEAVKRFEERRDGEQDS